MYWERYVRRALERQEQQEGELEELRRRRGESDQHFDVMVQEIRFLIRQQQESHGSNDDGRPDMTDHPYDPPLRQRMSELQIPSWHALRQTAGISRRALDQLRQGSSETLKLEQLQSVASTLEWSLEELLIQLKLLTPEHSPSAATPPLDPRQPQDVILEVQQHTFDRLQTLLTSYPTACHMAQAQPTLPAKNLIGLFRSLDTLLSDWQIQTIGSPWQQLPYDPQLHHPDQPEISPGDPVYIRYVGYRRGEQILCPAKVSRSLPGAAP